MVNQSVLLSIIISTSSRSNSLPDCLAGLAHNREPAPEIEVILVTDGEMEPLQGGPARIGLPYDLKVLRHNSAGKAAAWNYGAKSASGTYLLFLEDRFQPDPGLAAAHLRMQENYGGVFGMGNTQWGLRGGRHGFVDYVAQKRNRGSIELKEETRLSKFNPFPGNLSVPRRAFLDAGGFAAGLPAYEIPELCYRLERQGLPFIFVRDATGKLDLQKDLIKIIEEVEKEGKTSVELYRRHAALLRRLPLGCFHSERAKWVLLRRILLALHLPVLPLAAAGFLLGSGKLADLWYQFIYSCCYWRGVQFEADRDTWQRLSSTPLILIYHGIGGPGEPPSRYILPVTHFARQMAWLRFWRYKVLTLEDFLQAQRDHQLSPARSVIITFDDGYQDNYLHAYPLLKRYNYPATIFLVSRKIGSSNHWDAGSDLTGRPILSLPEIQEMQSGLISFGAHTRNHRRLTELPSDQVWDEVKGSRLDLETLLGRPVQTFSFPYGRYNPDIETAAERAGFLGACSDTPGFSDPGTPCYALRRTAIHGTESLIHFIFALWFGDTRVISNLWMKQRSESSAFFDGKSREHHRSRTHP